MKTKQEIYNETATAFAEKYGIITFEVNDNLMSYKEYVGNETYLSEVNLDTMKETRKQIA